MMREGRLGKYSPKDTHLRLDVRDLRTGRGYQNVSPPIGRKVGEASGCDQIEEPRTERHRVCCRSSQRDVSGERAASHSLLRQVIMDRQGTEGKVAEAESTVDDLPGRRF